MDMVNSIINTIFPRSQFRNPAKHSNYATFCSPQLSFHNRWIKRHTFSYASNLSMSKDSVTTGWTKSFIKVECLLIVRGLIGERSSCFQTWSLGSSLNRICNKADKCREALTKGILSSTARISYPSLRVIKMQSGDRWDWWIVADSLPE